MPHLYTLKQKAHSLHTTIYALYLAYKDTRARWYVRVLLAVSIAYAVSPLDLVPDLMPVFGYLDDVVMVAMGLSASYKLLPRDVLQEARLEAYEEMSRSVVAVKVIGYTWMLLLTLLAMLCYKFLFLNIPS
ncbi:YkvA family protein [Pontibacter anaerobius]|uniref:YkvA family protein n=1 Tax=Pontibacter anaerobius TaxID=2993940 RepID=A0ABT3RAH0_9BACT|nr:YkvA family protein [Pontibacter anaerobius]MCX2738438.1 YkvA family protein [Pontibacter anaerobius]